MDSLIFSMLVVLMLFYVVAFVSDFESGALVWQEVVERQRVAFSISELFLNDPGSPVGWVENPDRFGFAYYDFLKRQVRESVVFLPAKRVGFLNSLDSNHLNKLLNVGMDVAVVVESDLVDVCFPLKQCNENNKFVEGPVVVIAGGKSVDCVVVSRIVSVRTESDVGLGVLRVRVC
ncbi:MAG: hypothetical protein KAS30_04740 [Candidatus Diapherotrites archaeon]|nr:hypothetical protein [Candidatus Diapherotrites archaeon]